MTELGGRHAPFALMNRILVTGATGFLGGAVARRLAADGQHVVATGRRVEAGAALEASGIRFVAADVADAAAIRALVAGSDAVVHCAALAAPWGPYAAFHRANVGGTAAVAEACLARGARLVHVSTPSIYFHLDDRVDVREGDALPLVPVNPYAATKLLAEAVVQALVRAGLDAVVLRPRAIYGEGDRTVFPRLVRALTARRLPVVGDGLNVSSLSYVGNVVDAITTCLGAPAPFVGQAYNVADAKPVVLWRTIGTLCRRLGLPAPTRHVPVGRLLRVAGWVEAFHRRFRPGVEPTLTRYGVAVLGRSQTISTEAIRRDLGWAPRVGADEGMERFAAWWEREGRR